MKPAQVCQASWLGLVEYDQAWGLQARLAEEIAAGTCPPTLLLLEHPHTITIGRRGGLDHILWDEATLEQRGVAVREVDRGGDVTYHGPGQLVGYPLLPLASPVWGGGRLPQADFTGYLRKLERGLISLLARLGIACGQREGFTGVWVQPEVWARCVRCKPEDRPAPAKIASIGVKVDAKGISRHGFALNIAPEMELWESIIPCGLDGVRMACVADFINPPGMEEVAKMASNALGEALDLQMEWVAEI